MGLQDLVDVQVSAQTVTPSRASFGVPLVAAFHAIPGAAVQAFRSLAEAEDAGHVAGTPVHGILSAIFSQKTRPPAVLVGRRSGTWTQIVRLTPTLTTAGFKYKVTIGGKALEYTVLAGASVATICTALAAAIDALGAGVDATATATYVDVQTTAAATIVGYTGRSKELKLEDRTVGETNLATDLSAFETENPDFYGVLLDVSNKAALLAAAAWTETRSKILVVRTHDAGAADGTVNDDVLSALKTAEYARTIPVYHPDPGAFLDAAILADRLTADPGSDTWANKKLAGVTSYSLTGTEETAIRTKRGNFYTVIAGIPMFRPGVSSSGEFADVTRGIDWLKSRMGERVVYVLANNPKIPYTDAGVDVLKGEVLAQLDAGVTVGFLAASPAPVVTALPVADVDPIERAAREYSGLAFEAQLAGAIHKLTIRGTLRV